MKRTACSCILVAAAALAASGCRSSSPLPQGALLEPGNVVILTDEDVQQGNRACRVGSGKKVVIDSPGGGSFADQVTWIRVGVKSGEVHFKLKNPNDKNLFPDFEKPIKDGESKKESGTPQNPPSGGYVVGYEIRWKGERCDPEICIRKSGSGCEGFLETE